MGLKRAAGSGEEALNPQLPSGVCLHSAVSCGLREATGANSEQSSSQSSSAGVSFEWASCRMMPRHADKPRVRVKHCSITGLGVVRFSSSSSSFFSPK